MLADSFSVNTGQLASANSISHGLWVPPSSIFSVAARGNLWCTGCYANVLHRHDDRQEMDDARRSQLFRDAVDLGVSVMRLAGGEPLLRENLLHLTRSAPEILSFLFTSASLLDDATVRLLKAQSHVVPVLSVEGSQPFTDARAVREPTRERWMLCVDSAKHMSFSGRRQP